jgi:hypothetical protein
MSDMELASERDPSFIIETAVGLQGLCLWAAFETLFHDPTASEAEVSKAIGVFVAAKQRGFVRISSVLIEASFRCQVDECEATCRSEFKQVEPGGITLDDLHPYPISVFDCFEQVRQSPLADSL